MLYDPDANIICIELANGAISHAVEYGNIVIHFSKNGKPIIIEILEASNFVGQFDKLKKLKNLKKPLPAGLS